jgi:hypothetical protein
MSYTDGVTHREADGTAPRVIAPWRTIMLVVMGLLGVAVLVGLLITLSGANRQRDRALELQAHSYDVMILARTLSGTIAPGAYSPVQQGTIAAKGPPLPTPDATGTLALSGTAGKVALSTGSTALAGSCPTGNADFVGFGPTANCAEASAPTPAPSNTLAVVRAGGGCTDTNNNAADFVFVDTNGTSAGAGQRLGAPGPENLSSPISQEVSLSGTLLDPSVSKDSAPNRQRDCHLDRSDDEYGNGHRYLGTHHYQEARGKRPREVLEVPRHRIASDRWNQQHDHAGNHAERQRGSVRTENT